MPPVDTIPKTYPEAVTKLARWYGEAGAPDVLIFAANDLGDEIVRLVQVSDQFPDLGGVRIYRFGASADFPFRSAIALVRPEQWNRIKSGSGDPLLPADWEIIRAHRVWPSSDESQVS